MKNFCRARLGAALALVLLMGACGRSEPTGPLPALLRLSAAEAQWRAARLSNYSFNSTVSCFCLDEFGRTMRVTVRNGIVTAVTDRRTDRAYPLTWRQPVDSLFALVRREAVALPERLTVSYDVRLGFPRRVSWGAQEIDGGGVITIDSLRADSLSPAPQ